MLEVEYSAFKLAEVHMGWDEPIPQFATRFPQVLESCLETPFQRFAKRDLYRGMVEKASMLFYLLIKNHPFQNGNKRIAVMSLLYFLFKNDRWLTISTDDLYELARDVAKSKPEDRDRTMALIRASLKVSLIDFPQNASAE